MLGSGVQVPPPLPLLTTSELTTDELLDREVADAPEGGFIRFELISMTFLGAV